MVAIHCLRVVLSAPSHIPCLQSLCFCVRLKEGNASLPETLDVRDAEEVACESGEELSGDEMQETQEEEEDGGDGDVRWKLEFDDGEIKNVLRETYSIGSDPSNTYVTREPKVSAKHCTLRLTWREGSRCVVLKDTSRNGTFVNDEKVLKREVELRWGDKIQIVRGNKVNFGIEL